MNKIEPYIKDFRSKAAPKSDKVFYFWYDHQSPDRKCYFDENCSNQVHYADLKKEELTSIVFRDVGYNHDNPNYYFFRPYAIGETEDPSYVFYCLAGPRDSSDTPFRIIVE